MASTLIVCGSASHFADDVHTTCASCGTPIVHRPHAPDGRRICAMCAAVALTTDPRPFRIQISDETRREVALYNAKTTGSH